MPNRLADEKSPYLLQHKDNPVDWYPWGEEAFAAARALDRPIFLSIGYSTCHWCHVMAHESFEDERVAALMNEAFVNVKVDREERPDVDAVYMRACQLATGQGGWPLTVLTTPEGTPFFTATYLPREGRYGRIGMLDLVARIQQAWREKRDDVVASAEEIARVLKQSTASSSAGDALGADTLDAAYEQLAQRFDAAHGGFGTAPKFPSPHTLLFLLRYWRRTREDRALAMVEVTLQHMRRGGIFDHLGFGFHRYATDGAWLVPHFEKMLYDQALMVMAYTEAAQATGDAQYEQTARAVLAYVLRDMAAPEGGFFSAEDADSEGEEGRFYTWTTDEVRAVLGDDLAAVVADVFNMDDAGNYRDEATRGKTGQNILHLKAPLHELAAPMGLTPEALDAKMHEARRRLVAHRERRVHPGKDDKILADWNGLMIAALAKAARAFDDERYADAARRAAAFVRSRMRTGGGRLLHRHRAGETGLQANLDDYAFVIWGLIELYEVDFDVDVLRDALSLNRVVLDHFWDDEAGACFFTPDDGEALLIRQKELYDGAIPSGNAVMMLNLLRLARITGDASLEKRAEAIGRYGGDQVRRMPSGFTALLMAVDFALGPSHEVVVVGEPSSDDTAAMLAAIRVTYAPNKVVLLRSSEASAALDELAPFTAAMRPLDGRTTAYVCHDFACEAPTMNVEAVSAALANS